MRGIECRIVYVPNGCRDSDVSDYCTDCSRSMHTHIQDQEIARVTIKEVKEGRNEIVVQGKLPNIDKVSTEDLTDGINGLILSLWFNVKKEIRRLMKD